MIDRKVLSDLAIREPAAFEAIVGQGKIGAGREAPALGSVGAS